jgi:AcrR family transcriptional regulator
MQDAPSRNVRPTAAGRSPGRCGRPRDGRLDRAILDAARDLLIEHGYTRLRLEHVAARAGVGKATIYRRWRTKDELALDLLMELAAPHIAVPETGDTREELIGVVMNVVHALTETSFGPVLRALLAQVAINPAIGDPFRATVVRARREEVARVIDRGIARGDLRPGLDASIATELLAGPAYFRLVFGGALDRALAEGVVDALLAGIGTRSGGASARAIAGR